jgi:hypothetical protein
MSAGTAMWVAHALHERRMLGFRETAYAPHAKAEKSGSQQVDRRRLRDGSCALAESDVGESDPIGRPGKGHGVSRAGELDTHVGPIAITYAATGIVGG